MGWSLPVGYGLNPYSSELELSYVNIPSTIPLNFSSHLTTLSLTSTRLYGIIPESIFNLPSLETLDLSYNDQLSGYFPKTKWNSSASLTWLDLNSGNLLPESLGYITSLRSLSLSNCNRRGPIPESLSNLTRLVALVLDGNTLNGIIPSGMFSLPSLFNIQLSNNHFSGQLEDFKSNSLVWIDLRNNQLQRHLPDSIQNLVNLTRLDLSFNYFSGHVDLSLFSDLKQLSELDLSYNNFSGHVDVSLFSEFKHLWSLDLSYNSITLTNENKINCTWWPESLNTLRLAACQVKEWEFLRSAKQLEELDLSNNKIQGRIPDWEWSNWMFSLDRLNLSHNKLTSVDSIPLQGAYIIDLRSNVLQGSLPIPPNDTWFFFISQNNLSREIRSSICNSTSPQVLDLAGNNLHWEFPNVWEISLLSRFWICGVTIFLGIFQELSAIDSVRTIDLRSNELHGSIRTPTIENMFPNLRMLDLSSNAFSGNLPTTLFQHLKAMRTIDQTMMNAPIDVRYLYYQDSVAVVTKGLELEVVRILSLYTTIDLPNNKFEGHIPIESLDLSGNHLVGEKPAQFSSLTYLKVLNLSHNHLQGCIPQGPQLATFENNSYEGNDGLRGFPVSKGCGNDHVSDTVSGLDDHESYSEFLNDFWKAALMGFGKRFSSLIHLDLSNCYFKGQIPSEIFRLSKLQSLYFLGDNLKFGPHDFELLLQNLTQLRELDLTYVNISSVIPLNFSSHLTTLTLKETGLYGIIPESIFHLPNLERLELQFNDQLSGCFPKAKWNSSASLKVLDLNEVNLSGNFLPESLGYITSLQYLALAYCSLKGPIPESLSNLTRLEIGVSKIRKAASGVGSFNMLTSVGSIPLQSAEIIDLRSNLLHGSLIIPPKSTRYFFISENNLGEEIPSSICNLTSLVMLDLGRNNLRGEIPQCLGKITALEVLDMHLSGNLPTTFISGSSLRRLNLHGDKLEGRVPQSLTNCNELQVLDLGDNHLIGTFPMWLGTLPPRFYYSCNQGSGA
ncbi:hypothetical protein CQW23_28953 [Capsicum baccatum]|uniref:Disease resistance R13L4/SHOC-2-like LRR domain-containing protein n=1 Tax=Capsicum baccatum TaxID=33114 RepID=A0A2G2VI11_CAPBA|nr:hypothetical protein CQW23_28953 [Capsicum baccatum]